MAVPTWATVGVKGLTLYLCDLCVCPWCVFT